MTAALSAFAVLYLSLAVVTAFHAGYMEASQHIMRNIDGGSEIADDCAAKLKASLTRFAVITVAWAALVFVTLSGLA